VECFAPRGSTVFRIFVAKAVQRISLADESGSRSGTEHRKKRSEARTENEGILYARQHERSLPLVGVFPGRAASPKLRVGGTRPNFFFEWKGQVSRRECDNSVTYVSDLVKTRISDTRGRAAYQGSLSCRQPADGENDAPGRRRSHSLGVVHTWGTPFFCSTQRDLDRCRRGRTTSRASRRQSRPTKCSSRVSQCC